MKKGMKEFLDFTRKHMRKVVALSVLAVMTMIPAFAAVEGVEGVDTAAIGTAFTSGLTSVVTMSIELITSILPIAITLFGVMFLVKKAPKWFQKMAG